MVKGLKRRLIVITMSIIILMFVVIFFAVCFFTYETEMKETISFLEQVALKKPQAPPDGFGNIDMDEPFDGKHGDKFFQLPKMYTFHVFVNSEGIVEHSGIGSSEIEEQSLKFSIKQILESKDTSGRIDGADLIYLKKPTQGGTNIVFTSSIPLDNAVQDVAIIALIICLVCIVAFFFLMERIASYAIKPVKTAWESQKQFIADASHDLKTPLTVILANNDILLSHQGDTVQNQEKWIKSTKEEALKMKGLVEQLLDLAKSEDINKGLALSQENISELTEGEILQFEPIAFEKEITVNSCIKESVLISTHGESYVRIVQTLLDNAIRYTEQGKQIDVLLLEDKQRAYLKVKNPSFIEESDLDHIFERFYRIDPSRSEGGHGLGLAIAKNLASSINGDIEVESSKDTGTTFTLSIKKK